MGPPNVLGLSGRAIRTTQRTREGKMLYVPTHVKDQSPLLTAATTLVCLSLSLSMQGLSVSVYMLSYVWG